MIKTLYALKKGKTEVKYSDLKKVRSGLTVSEEFEDNNPELIQYFQTKESALENLSTYQSEIVYLWGNSRYIITEYYVEEGDYDVDEEDGEIEFLSACCYWGFTDLYFNVVDENNNVIYQFDNYEDAKNLKITNDEAVNIKLSNTMINNLARIRKSKGLSQSKLAELSKVNIRLIQDYEQGHKDINNAKAITLLKLSNILECSIEDLMQ